MDTHGTLRLYHGSSEAVERPLAGHNTGFADLGRGFYLTDDLEVARLRARSRARREGVPAGVVSVFDFDEEGVAWASWSADGPRLPDGADDSPFGLRFDDSGAGVVAWAEYVRACRAGKTAVPGLGEPAVVRAWIATEELEMVCAGLVPADALADFVDPSELVVQYCLLDQHLIDGHLRFVEAERVARDGA